MTNYEWLVKNNAELAKDILAYGISKEKGKIGRCSQTMCIKCDFDDPFCSRNTKKWLEEEYEPLYKKGDIVVDSYNQMVLVVEDGYDEDIMVSRYVEDYKRNQHTISITDIKKKVGHIDESEV